jgi:hypothetical protein
MYKYVNFIYSDKTDVINKFLIDKRCQYEYYRTYPQAVLESTGPPEIQQGRIHMRFVGSLFIFWRRGWMRSGCCISSRLEDESTGPPEIQRERKPRVLLSLFMLRICSAQLIVHLKNLRRRKEGSHHEKAYSIRNCSSGSLLGTYLCGCVCQAGQQG